ncbi:hypothetical protein MN116_001094 [Schistosoma mekongi]|uniref:Uncharacterized protein n=1 Tax=Schistosoma mekongi TaxID=38744 RepID=A0AAE1ZLF6_SCHME|nr:hypothetical protein MN116_001094 [Schistosoma mekongi]
MTRDNLRFCCIIKMVMHSSDVNFPARQLFIRSNNYSVDKMLLTKRRQEEAEIAMRSSAEHLQKKFNFDIECFTQNREFKNSLIWFDYSQSNKMSKNVLKCFSTPTITKNNNNKNIQSFDFWQWEVINTKNQYVPSFYLSKQYHSDTCITVDQSKNLHMLQTPTKQSRCTKINQAKNDTTQYSTSKYANTLKNIVEISKKEKYIPTKINSWNMPVKKWPQYSNHNLKQIGFNRALDRSNSLTKLDSTELNQRATSTTNSLEDLRVSKSILLNSDVKYGISKQERSNGKTITSPGVRYRQMTLLELLPKWREQSLSHPTVS